MQICVLYLFKACPKTYIQNGWMYSFKIENHYSVMTASVMSHILHSHVTLSMSVPFSCMAFWFSGMYITDWEPIHPFCILGCDSVSWSTGKHIVHYIESYSSSNLKTEVSSDPFFMSLFVFHVLFICSSAILIFIL